MTRGIALQAVALALVVVVLWLVDHWSLPPLKTLLVIALIMVSEMLYIVGGFYRDKDRRSI